MAEEILNDFYPDFNELESKVGRKTPESLLVWMKDAAADCEGWTADPSCRSDHTSDGLSDKINTLKQEMRWLRCADVRILRQLVAVHEGIEAMRWLMEERGLQASRCSSLSGSLSSLVTIEEHVPSTSPCREDPTPAFPQDIRLTANTKPADQNPQRAETSELPSPSESIQVESCAQAPLPGANTLVSADAPKSEAPDSGSTRFHIRNGAETIKRALLRSSRRKQLKAASQGAGEKNTEHPTQQSLSVFKRQEVKKDEEETSAGGEKDLLGYDAQWSWVESKDDVTFL
ncbi:leucine rich adaptor protein 1-like [Poecilia reticulata]|uniref:leucine rich adaptor protein 1-like n=1 Tax=Poecilia reticulata TaxID=8081 RepID=UPI0004A268AD|nr:PREDICTED: leucine rich adaptor protein 1-like [Poecilia reticulata]XP_008431375.1 PREDICTED: leucine rich adaptor protein 1-like [Poecilia reticulata]